VHYVPDDLVAPGAEVDEDDDAVSERLKALGYI